MRRWIIFLGLFPFGLDADLSIDSAWSSARLSLGAAVAHAARAKPKAKKRGAKGKPEAAPNNPSSAQPPAANPSTRSDEAVAPKPAAARGSSDRSTAKADGSTTELLGRAKALYEALEYEAVIPLAEAVLAREDATVDMRLDAYLMQGSALAIVGDPIEAEKPFRFLMRGRPDFDLPAETPPKILSVFRKVQVEERSIAQQMKEIQRARIVRELKLDPQMPKKIEGGTPLQFDFVLRDPGRAVSSLDVHYRRARSESFSSLALKIDERTGAWRGELPGEWTENENGLSVEYYVVTRDQSGAPLLQSGEARTPFLVEIAPGKVADARPFYQSVWFWTATGAAVIASGVGAWAVIRQATKLPDTNGRVDLSK